jgi:hypothetical protein
LPKPRNDPLDEVKFELLLGQPDDSPSRQRGFEILLGICGVSEASARTSVMWEVQKAHFT